MPVPFSRLLCFAITLAAFLFPSLIHAQNSEITFPSPDGRWSIFAHWIKDYGGGYLYELHDNVKKKTYLKTVEIPDNPDLPIRVNVLWSPDSRRVALSLYDGRTEYWATLVDTQGDPLQEIPLLTPLGDKYDGWMGSAKRWRSSTELEINVIGPPSGSNDEGGHWTSAFTLRFTSRGTKAIPITVPDVQEEVREKSLALLHDIVPASTSGRARKTMKCADGLVCWGNLFDPREVVAFVNLASEKPNDTDSYYDEEQLTRHLSFCVWRKDHWEYRQYLDDARNLEFHDRKDFPHHFVQASRKTGRYDGDFLSWYYDPKTEKLVRTHYEDWGPFYLTGNYLCTLRGFERKAFYETVWVYPYKNGRQGDLLATYDSDIGRGELRNFSITFRDHKTGAYWTYAFSPKENEPPYLHYTIDATEGVLDEPPEVANTRIHHAAELEVSAEDESTDQYCFERLTGLSTAVLDHETWREIPWNDPLPAKPPVKQIKFDVTGDPEIVRHLQKP